MYYACSERILDGHYEELEQFLPLVVATVCGETDYPRVAFINYGVRQARDVFEAAFIQVVTSASAAQEVFKALVLDKYVEVLEALFVDNRVKAEVKRGQIAVYRSCFAIAASVI